MAAIAPYAHTRQALRSAHTTEGIGFAEVHVATPLDVCRQRDVKGLYARQTRGEITGPTGVDAVYEVPTAPDLRIDTSVEQSAATLTRFVVDAVRLGP